MKTRSGKVFKIVLVLVVLLSLLAIAGVHFFCSYKNEHAFDSAIKMQEYEFVVKLSDSDIKCESVGYAKFDCKSESGLVYLRNNELVSFKNISFSTSFATLRNIQILNISSDLSNFASVNNLIFPIDFSFQNNLNDKFQVSLKGAFGTFAASGDGTDIITVSLSNDNFMEYFEKFFTSLRQEVERYENVTSEEFIQTAVNTLENFKRFPNISPHHASLLNAFQNVLRGESNGVNLKFRIKTKDEGAIKTAVQNMIIKRTVDTDVFDVEISNL